MNELKFSTNETKSPVSDGKQSIPTDELKFFPKKKASFHAYLGLFFTILSWILPLGMLFATAGIFSGCVGLYYDRLKNKKLSIISFITILSGNAVNLIYDYGKGNFTNLGTWIMFVFSLLVILGIISLKFRKK
jgi:hypothetical protein